MGRMQEIFDSYLSLSLQNSSTVFSPLTFLLLFHSLLTQHLFQRGVICSREKATRGEAICKFLLIPERYKRWELTVDCRTVCQKVDWLNASVLRKLQSRSPAISSHSELLLTFAPCFHKSLQPRASSSVRWIVWTLSFISLYIVHIRFIIYIAPNIRYLTYCYFSLGSDVVVWIACWGPGGCVSTSLKCSSLPFVESFRWAAELLGNLAVSFTQYLNRLQLWMSELMAVENISWTEKVEILRQSAWGERTNSTMVLFEIFPEDRLCEWNKKK